jgi:hypothetical protein
MRSSGKDSSEVIKFMTLLAKLKGWSDDKPEDLAALAKENKALNTLCHQLSSAANSLKMNERRYRELFAAPVDPEFIIAWREFENRYQRVLTEICFEDIFGDILLELRPAEQKRTSDADVRWGMADEDAAKQELAIEGAIEFAHDQVTQDWREFQEGFRESIEDGIAAWTRLKCDTGFDLRGIFRRRALIPFVLVPRHVAAQHGSAEKLSMLTNLQQAHDAFVFGAPFAALALMRSLTEAVLRDRYGAQGKSLEERINSCTNLPRGAGIAALHRLRNLANAILHLRAKKDEGLPKVEPLQLEKEIVSLLFVLRALIEGTPK